VKLVRTHEGGGERWWVRAWWRALDSWERAGRGRLDCLRYKPVRLPFWVVPGSCISFAICAYYVRRVYIDAFLAGPNNPNAGQRFNTRRLVGPWPTCYIYLIISLLKFSRTGGACIDIMIIGNHHGLSRFSKSFNKFWRWTTVNIFTLISLLMLASSSGSEKTIGYLVRRTRL